MVPTLRLVTHANGCLLPIGNISGNVLGSLSLTLMRKNLDAAETRHIAERVMFGARIVAKAVSQ